MTEREAYERYDEMLDSCNPVIKIGTLEYSPSRVLQEVDETAYKCCFNDFCDADNIEIED